MASLLSKISKLLRFSVIRLLLQIGPDWYWQKKISNPITTVGDRVLNPRAHAYLQLLSQLSNPKEEWTVSGSRIAYMSSIKAFDGPQKSVRNVKPLRIVIEDRVLSGRLYDPRPQSLMHAGAAIVFFHGGGGVIGSIDTHDRLCRRLAGICDLPVISVSYRLSPEHVFPAAVHDACDFWDWLQYKSKDLSIDSQNIFVIGDSFGANLAIAICSKFSKRLHTNNPVAVVLIYPPVDASITSKSRQELADEPLLFNDALEWFEEVMFPVKKVRSNFSLDKKSLEFFPPALVFACGFDSLRDDGLELTKNLKDYKVPVQFIEYRSMFHGFLTASSVFPESQDLLRKIKLFIDDNQN